MMSFMIIMMMIIFIPVMKKTFTRFSVMIFSLLIILLRTLSVNLFLFLCFTSLSFFIILVISLDILLCPSTINVTADNSTIKILT